MYNMGHLPPNFFPTAIPCQETRFKKQESGDQMNFRLPCDRGGEGICERKSRGGLPTFTNTILRRSWFSRHLYILFIQVHRWYMILKEKMRLNYNKMIITIRMTRMQQQPGQTVCDSHNNQVLMLNIN